MEQEKTLLQQIRDKEQEFGKKVETVKRETEVQISAAKSEREKALLDAEKTGKKAAEEFYSREKLKTETEIALMKKTAAAETETARVTGQKNLPSSIEKIINFVIME